MESSTVAPNCYGCFSAHSPSACPFVAGFNAGYNKTVSPLMNVTGALNANTFPSSPVNPTWPSTFFGGASGFESRFPSSWPMTSSFEGRHNSWNMPSTFEGRHHHEMNMPSTWNWGPMTSFEGRHHMSSPYFGGFEGRNAFPSSFEGRHFNGTPSSWFNHPMARHMLPYEVRDVAFRPTSMVEFWSLCNPVHIHPIDGSRFLHLCFDVKGFKPEEVNITVSLKERTFTVEAKHEVKDNKEHAVVRSYIRKFTIPAEYCCDLTKVEKEIKTCFTHDGLLVVEARLPAMTAEELKNFREKAPMMSYNKSLSTGVCDSHFHGPLARSVPIKTVA